MLLSIVIICVCQQAFPIGTFLDYSHTHNIPTTEFIQSDGKILPSFELELGRYLSIAVVLCVGVTSEEKIFIRDFLIRLFGLKGGVFDTIEQEIVHNKE